eukprot:1191853-Amphidinium_carterae.1
MQPLPADAATIKDLGDLLTWARVSECFRALWLYGHPGYRFCCFVASQDANYYDSLPDGSPFSPAMHAQAALLGHAARAMLRPSCIPQWLILRNPRLRLQSCFCRGLKLMTSRGAWTTEVAAPAKKF